MRHGWPKPTVPRQILRFRNLWLTESLHSRDRLRRADPQDAGSEELGVEAKVYRLVRLVGAGYPVFMPTYVYETVPSDQGESIETFEVHQSMADPPLTRHPETGRPIRRVISGGFGVLTRSGSGSPAPAPRPAGGCCGGHCGGHHH